MKKYLIVLAVALVALAGCKPKENGSAITNLSFKQTELSGLAGDTLRLALVVTPAEAPVPEDLVWSSSDDEVVTVVDKKGNIALVSPGTANITAKSGELSAVCKVNVYTYEEAWAPSTTCYYLDDQSDLPVSDTVITYTTSKATYTCKLYSVTLLFCSNIDIPGGDPGEGDWIFAPAVVPFIEESSTGEYIGEIWDIAFQIVPDDKVNSTEFGAFAGDIDENVTGQAWQTLLETIDGLGEGETITQEMLKAFGDAYEPGIFGAYIKDAIIEDGSIYSNFWIDGIVTDGHIQTLFDENSELYADYDLEVKWCNGYVPGLGFCGLKTDLENAQSYSELLIQPFELDLYTYLYKTGEIGQEDSGLAPAPLKVSALNKLNKAKYTRCQTIKKAEPVKYKVAKLK